MRILTAPPPPAIRSGAARISLTSSIFASRRPRIIEQPAPRLVEAPRDHPKCVASRNEPIDCTLWGSPTVARILVSGQGTISARSVVVTSSERPVTTDCSGKFSAGGLDPLPTASLRDPSTELPRPLPSKLRVPCDAYSSRSVMSPLQFPIHQFTTKQREKCTVCLRKTAITDSDNDHDHSFSQLSVHKKALICTEGQSAWGRDPPWLAKRNSLCADINIPGGSLRTSALVAVFLLVCLLRLLRYCGGSAVDYLGDDE